MSAALERAVREIAERTSNLITDDSTDAQVRTLRDAAELVRTLARMVSGKNLHQSFGAPGDWGYGRPIGDALMAIYSGKQS